MFISIPMMQFMATQDLKVDAALVLFGITAITFLFRFTGDKVALSQKLLLTIGLLLGVCLSIKLTAVYLIFAVAGVIVYQHFFVRGIVAYVSLILLLL